MKTDFGEALYLGEAKEREREKEKRNKEDKKDKAIPELINTTNTKWLSLTWVHHHGNHFVTYIRKITTQPSSP